MIVELVGTVPSQREFALRCKVSNEAAGYSFRMSPGFYSSTQVLPGLISAQWLAKGII